MLFEKLVSSNKEKWEQYLHHEFLKQLENGTLPYENFLFYLEQDYLFLLNYAKCYAKLATKARTKDELHFALKLLNQTLQGEIELHKSILNLGLKATPDTINESLANIAYTRYVLDIIDSGDFLEGLVALSACAIGYGYAGKEILSKIPEKSLHNHPYRKWLELYGSKEFNDEVMEFERFVNGYSVDESKFKRLDEIFASVVRLEINFWQHSLKMQMDF